MEGGPGRYVGNAGGKERRRVEEREIPVQLVSKARPAAPSADMEALLERIEAMEGRIDKHQQDLTALLKLVRQLAAKKEEKPETKKVKKSVAPATKRAALLSTQRLSGVWRTLKGGGGRY